MSSFSIVNRYYIRKISVRVKQEHDGLILLLITPGSYKDTGVRVFFLQDIWLLHEIAESVLQLVKMNWLPILSFRWFH